MIFTAEMISAQRAYEIGLVNEVVTQPELLERTKAIASKISQNSSVAIAKAIEAMNLYHSDEGFDMEIKNFGELFDEDDFQEGTTAFMEKRKPNCKEMKMQNLKKKVPHNPGGTKGRGLEIAKVCLDPGTEVAPRGGRGKEAQKAAT